MDISTNPRVGVDGLPMGSCRQNVRAFFGSQPEPFKRTPGSNEADYWPALGAFAYFDDSEALEALEFAAPAKPTLAGQILTSLPLQKAKQVLRSLDDDVAFDGDGAISRRLGISIWSGAGAHGMVESVLCFAPGYYD